MVPCLVASGKDIAYAKERQGRSPWTATNRDPEQNIDECETLLIDVHEKEEHHGDHTTAWQTAGYY